MKWFKKLGIASLILLLVLVAVAGALYWAASTVPEFYEQAMHLKISPKERKAAARQFEKQTQKLATAIQRPGEWSESFSAMQINSWLMEDKEARKEWQPEGITDPRVDFKTDVIRIGFRYSSSLYSGVVSLELKPKVRSPYEVEIQIAAIRAGVLSLPLNQVLAQLRDQLEVEGAEMVWEESGGRKTVVLRFPKPDPREVQGQPKLRSIEVRNGRLVVNGKSDPGTYRPGMRVLALPRSLQNRLE